MNILHHLLIGTIVYNCVSVWCHVPFAQPGFLSSPTSIEGDLNETIRIPCVVHDLGKNTLRWWKDGVLLSDSSDDSLITPPRITILSDNMLTVESLEAEDAGNYTCQIVRAYPRLPVEQVHKVRVKIPPQIIVIPADGNIEAMKGEEVQMGCMASGWPAPVVTWKFKDEIMKSMDNRHMLVFTADDPSKSGVYQCEANNTVGPSVTSSILLKILYAPQINVDTTWVHASPGIKCEIECLIDAEPRPNVQWLHEGKPLDRDSSRMTNRVHGKRHILSFRRVFDTDFGEYACRAWNKIGQMEKTIQLSGLAYPAVFKKNRGLVSPDSYSFIWEVESYSPIIEYKLLFKKVEDERKEWIQLIIPADADSPGPLHSKSYTLSGLKLFTIYQAQLLSRNRFGWSQPSQTIRFGTDGTSELVEDEDKPVSGEITGTGHCSTPKAFGVFLLPAVTMLHRMAHTFPVNM